VQLHSGNLIMQLESGNLIVQLEGVNLIIQLQSGNVIVFPKFLCVNKISRTVCLAVCSYSVFVLLSLLTLPSGNQVTVRQWKLLSIFLAVLLLTISPRNSGC